MSGAGVLRVVHVVPPGGGGVERCVREVVRHRPDDLVVHAAGSQCVLEWPALSQFFPMAPDDLVELARSGVLGSPGALHAHGTVEVVRSTCRRLAAVTGAPVVLTLHDVWFADTALPADELAQRIGFAREAAARTAPSRYIVELARRTLGDAVRCDWVPNGAETIAPVDDALVRLSDIAGEAIGEMGFAVAVIGAIGAHKGLDVLEEVARRLPDGVRVVVFGYTERHLRQGWAVPGKLWVHGIFDPAQLPALVRRYRPQLAFFPPGMPESHCYALTDAWMCGLPVLAPDHGALAERVDLYGGGELYPPQVDAGALAGRIVERLAATAAAAAEPLRLQRPLPTMDEMVAQLGEVYRRAAAAVGTAHHSVGAVTATSDLDAARRVAQRQLDSRFFRLEVLHQQREIDALALDRSSLAQRLAQAQAELLAARHEADEWQGRYRRLVARLARPVAWLPAPARARLVRLARRLLRADDPR